MGRTRRLSSSVHDEGVSEQPDPQPIKVRWPDDAAASPDFVNQFVIMNGSPVVMRDALVDEGVIYLLLGHVVPPLIFDQEDADRVQLRGEAIARPRASLMMGRTRAIEFWTILGRNLGMLPPDAPTSFPTSFPTAPENQGGQQ